MRNGHGGVMKCIGRWSCFPFSGQAAQKYFWRVNLRCWWGISAIGWILLSLLLLHACRSTNLHVHTKMRFLCTGRVVLAFPPAWLSPTNVWNLGNCILIVLRGSQSSFSGKVNIAVGILKENEDSRGLGDPPRVLQKTPNVTNTAWSAWFRSCYTCPYPDQLQQITRVATSHLSCSSPSLFHSAIAS